MNIKIFELPPPSKYLEHFDDPCFGWSLGRTEANESEPRAGYSQVSPETPRNFGVEPEDDSKRT